MKMFESLLGVLAANSKQLNEACNAKNAGKEPGQASRSGGRTISQIIRQAIASEYDAVGRTMSRGERSVLKEQVEIQFGQIWDFVKVYVTNASQVLDKHDQRAKIGAYWAKGEVDEIREKVWSVSRTYRDITFNLTNILSKAVNDARALGLPDDVIANTFASIAPTVVIKKRQAA